MMITLEPEAWIRRASYIHGTKKEELAEQALLRLFCFPFAGGGASVYNSWSEGLPSGVDVCPVQLPGRENRLAETPYTQLTLLVETLAQVLQPYLNIPFVIFGHSMGALISFELAREIQRRYNLNPAYLFVAACRAPHLPDPHPPIHHLPEAAFLAEVRYFGGTPPAFFQELDLLELFLPSLQADFELYETYIYRTGARLDCPISAFGGLQDRQVKHFALEAWQKHTCDAFSLRMFPGDHLFIKNDSRPLLQSINEDLSTLLAGN